MTPNLGLLLALAVRHHVSPVPLYPASKMVLEEPKVPQVFEAAKFEGQALGTRSLQDDAMPGSAALRSARQHGLRQANLQGGNPPELGEGSVLRTARADVALPECLRL
ncbi:MAG: hypothetical protein NT154_22195 [Verrucomicrobia bacterium]|nr:hypothetical protein [Verrucomicrobiota bacterium]